MKTITMSEQQYQQYIRECQNPCEQRAKWEIIRDVLKLGTDDFVWQSAVITSEYRESLNTLIITILD